MLVSARNLSFFYGKKKVIDNVTLGLDKGQCMAVTGGNGTGKTTLVSLIAGILKPKSGEVRINGRYAFVPQETGLFDDMTVSENIDFFRNLSGLRGHFPGSYLLGLEKYKKNKISELSGGTKRRASILCAIAQEPDLLILDEPCAGLDESFRAELKQILIELKEKGTAMIYVGHDPEEYQAFTDKVLLLNRKENI